MEQNDETTARFFNVEVFGNAVLGDFLKDF